MDCSYTSLLEIHNHYQHNLRLTDKPLAELLEALLFLKAFAANWEHNLNFRLNI